MAKCCFKKRQVDQCAARFFHHCQCKHQSEQATWTNAPIRGRSFARQSATFSRPKSRSRRRRRRRRQLKMNGKEATEEADVPRIARRTDDAAAESPFPHSRRRRRGGSEGEEEESEFGCLKGDGERDCGTRGLQPNTSSDSRSEGGRMQLFTKIVGN